MENDEIFNTAVDNAFEFVCDTAKNAEPEGVGELTFRAIEKMRKHLNDEEIQAILGIGVVNAMFAIRQEGE